MRIRVPFLSPVLLLAAILAAPPSLSAAGIEWQDSLTAALEAAKAENVPILIAVNMDGERVCEELCKRHYKDSKIVKLSNRMVCLFASKYFHKGGDKACPRAGCIPCAAHQQVEKDVRADILGVAPGEEMIAPNHVLVGPDGKIILSVPYMITTGQLEWCMVEAMRKINPSFKWSLSAAARAPRRVLYGEMYKEGEGGGARPLSGEELKETLDAIRKGSGRGGRGGTMKQYFPSLIVTDDKDAMKVVSQWLTSRWSGRGGQGARIVHDIGRTSPQSWWEVVAPLLSHPDPGMRNEAIVALEQLAAPKSLKALTKQKSVEKEDAALGNLIRAIASVGRGSRSPENLVLKAAERDKKDFIRINALIGLVYIENREKVNTVLLKGLTDTNPGVRAAAAYTIAVRRENDLAEALVVALQAETNFKCKAYIEAASAALKGGGLKLVEGVLREYAHDEISRDRM